MAEAAEYQSTPRGTPTGWAALAPALRSRAFRLFWLGQLISVMGTAVQVVAEGWLIYQITGSTFWLGAVSFIALVPVVPISFLGGLIIDRFPRRKLILATQSGLLVQAAIFGLLGLTGQIQLWHIIALNFVFGALLAIDHPARRAFLVELVPQEDLGNAVALNAMLFNLSSLVGYAVSGVLIATVGAGGTMLFNAATYVAPICALLVIRVRDVAQDTSRPTLRVALMEGIATVWKDPALVGTFGLVAVVGGLSAPILAMMPAFAEEVLGVDSVGLGLLLAASALGSLAGTIVTARIGGRGRGRALAIVSILVPLLMVGFAFSRTLIVASLWLVALGLVLLMLQTLAITLVQLYIPDRVRGRVMTLYSQVHAGSETIGNVMIGGLAVSLGLPVALGLGAGLSLLYALGFQAVTPSVRRLD